MIRTARTRNELLRALDARPPDALLTLSEAAAFLEKSEKRIRNLAGEKRLAVAGRGWKRKPLFLRAELERFLREGLS